jgi:hypothetical protein
VVHLLVLIAGVEVGWLLLGVWLAAVAACLLLIYREAHRQRRPATLRLLYDRRRRART